MSTDSPPRSPCDPLSLDDVVQRMPLVARIGADLAETWRALLGARQLLEHPESTCDGPGSDELTRDLNRMVDRMNGYISEIESLGGHVDEFHSGSISFSVREGQALTRIGWSASSPRCLTRRPAGAPLSDAELCAELTL